MELSANESPQLGSIGERIKESSEIRNPFPPPIADFFALGDGEDCLPEIGRCLARCKARGLDREETLYALATEVEGIYVPRFYEAPGGWGGAVFPTREGVPPRVKRRVATPDPFMQVRHRVASNERHMFFFLIIPS